MLTMHILNRPVPSTEPAAPARAVPVVTAADCGLLLIRSTVGPLMAGHGAQKIFGLFGAAG